MPLSVELKAIESEKEPKNKKEENGPPQEEEKKESAVTAEKAEENDLNSMVSVKLKWGGVVYLEVVFRWFKKKLRILIEKKPQEKNHYPY